MIWKILRGLRTVIVLGALAVLCTPLSGALADYLATQGTGTTFASLVISTKHYAAMVWCDATAGETQCAAVNSSGQIAIAGPVTNTGTFAVQATLQASSATAIGTVNPTTATNWGILAQGSTTSSEVGHLMMGAVTTSAPSYTTAQTSPFSLDTAGNLRVNVVTGGGSGGTSSTFGSAFPGTGTAIGLTNGTNMVGWSATTNYGTAPAAIAVPAVNAFVTNTNANIGTNADGIPASATIASPVAGFNFLWNGATFDRQQEAASTGTGALAGAALANLSSQYPSGATAVTASGTGSSSSFLTTLAGTSGKTTYLCGFSARALATAASNGQLTVSNTITANMSYLQWIAPLASGIGIVEEVYNPCVPATGTNTGIGIGTANPGSGGVQSVSAWGYQK